MSIIQPQLHHDSHSEVGWFSQFMAPGRCGCTSSWLSGIFPDLREVMRHLLHNALAYSYITMGWSQC